jgi:hypothetical protein
MFLLSCSYTRLHCSVFVICVQMCELLIVCCMGSQDLTLQGCVFTPLLEAVPDSLFFDVNYQLEVVHAAFQESGPARPCRAAAQALWGSTSLPLFVELGVHLVDSMAVDPCIVGGQLSETSLEARCLYKMVAALQQELLLLLQRQLQPVSTLSKLHASAHSALDPELSKLVKTDVCSKLGSRRGFNTMSALLDAALKQVLAPCSIGHTRSAAEAEAAAAAHSPASDAAAGASAQPVMPAAASICIDVMCRRLLEYISFEQLQEQVELFQQSSHVGAAELLERVFSPLLVPQLQHAMMHAAAVAPVHLPALRRAAQQGQLQPAVVAQVQYLDADGLVQVFGEIFEVSGMQEACCCACMLALV